LQCLAEGFHDLWQPPMRVKPALRVRRFEEWVEGRSIFDQLTYEGLKDGRDVTWSVGVFRLAATHLELCTPQIDIPDHAAGEVTGTQGHRLLHHDGKRRPGTTLGLFAAVEEELLRLVCCVFHF